MYIYIYIFQRWRCIVEARLHMNEALCNFKLLQLPCVRTLKYYIDANLESAGDSLEHLQQSRNTVLWLKRQKERVEEKKKDARDSSNEGTITIILQE